MDSAADRAARGVRALIAQGEYGPGDRLPAERDLAEQLGLSRPALREGIRRLRSGGVLNSRRGSGTYVAEVDMQGVFDVRVRLEPLAAERAAMRRTDRQAAEMRAIADQLPHLIEDAPRLTMVDAELHRRVALAARSPVLSGTLERLTELMSLSRAVTAASITHRREGVRDMERVVLAIERKHPKRAANAMEKHLVMVRSIFMEAAETLIEPAVDAGADAAA